MFWATDGPHVQLCYEQCMCTDILIGREIFGGGCFVCCNASCAAYVSSTRLHQPSGILDLHKSFIVALWTIPQVKQCPCRDSLIELLALFAFFHHGRLSTLFTDIWAVEDVELEAFRLWHHIFQKLLLLLLTSWIYDKYLDGPFHEMQPSGRWEVPMFPEVTVLFPLSKTHIIANLGFVHYDHNIVHGMVPCQNLLVS